MNKKSTNFLIALFVLLIVLIVFATKASAGGPWNDQYCDVEITKIKVIDQDGNVIQNLTEEKVVCNDGAKDFLHGMGIASSCEIFTWHMPLGETFIEQRDIACQRLDGGYEIVPGYHSIE